MNRIRKVIIKITFIVVFIFTAIAANAAGNDSALTVLTLDEFIDIIKKYHPTAKRAVLITQQGRAELLKARGNFDPVLSSRYENKDFAGINYYNYFNAEIKIPTWYGVEIKGGIEDLDGQRTNPENTLGQTSYLGVSLPLAKNLLMDRRRMLLKQSKIGVMQSEQETLLMMNDLLYEAVKAYWTWAYSYKSYQLLKNIIEANNNRFKFVKSLQAQGEVAAIDTVEARAQLYNFSIALSETEVNLANAALEVSNYLWLENDEPYALPVYVTPDTLWDIADFNSVGSDVLDTLAGYVLENHPKLQSYGYKLDALETERRFRSQNLLPDFNVSANLLSKGYGNFEGVDRAYLENNNKFSIYFGIPLRLSEARAERQKTLLKITETEYAQASDKLAIQNKINQSVNELLALREQIRLAEIARNDYAALYNAETNRFALGESSLFLVNSRETRLLDSQKKLIELKAGYYKWLATLQWSAGQLQ